MLLTSGSRSEEAGPGMERQYVPNSRFQPLTGANGAGFVCIFNPCAITQGAYPPLRHSDSPQDIVDADLAHDFLYLPYRDEEAGFLADADPDFNHHREQTKRLRDELSDSLTADQPLRRRSPVVQDEGGDILVRPRGQRSQRPPSPSPSQASELDTAAQIARWAGPKICYCAAHAGASGTAPKRRKTAARHAFVANAGGAPGVRTRQIRQGPGPFILDKVEDRDDCHGAKIPLGNKNRYIRQWKQQYIRKPPNIEAGNGTAYAVERSDREMARELDEVETGDMTIGIRTAEERGGHDVREPDATRHGAESMPAEIESELSPEPVEPGTQSRDRDRAVDEEDGHSEDANMQDLATPAPITSQATPRANEETLASDATAVDAQPAPEGEDTVMQDAQPDTLP